MCPSATLQEKNPEAFAFLAKLQLTTDQQSEIAGWIDRDGMSAAAAAAKWVAANPDVVAGWLSADAPTAGTTLTSG